ncbi:hypothetical protein A6M14_06645 [Acinetobacter sp. Ac_877]|nr:hypothetical protein [Acinetobacter portensis]
MKYVAENKRKPHHPDGVSLYSIKGKTPAIYYYLLLILSYIETYLSLYDLNIYKIKNDRY